MRIQAILALALCFCLIPAREALAKSPTGQYIVALADGSDARVEARRLGVSPKDLFEAALAGFAAQLTPEQVVKLQRDPMVDSVTPDKSRFRLTDVYASPQVVDNGVRRIRGLESPTARIDGIDKRVDVDIAIIDSGVDMTHPDLNVGGGKDCSHSGSLTGPFADHGTYVAGIAAGIDNTFGDVGVAPGARIWSVRVVDDTGGILDSYLLCAVEWLIKNSRTIEVANMSLGGPALETGTDSCGVAYSARSSRGKPPG